MAALSPQTLKSYGSSVLAGYTEEGAGKPVRKEHQYSQQN